MSITRVLVLLVAAVLAMTSSTASRAQDCVYGWAVADFDVTARTGTTFVLSEAYSIAFAGGVAATFGQDCNCPCVLSAVDAEVDFDPDHDGFTVARGLISLGGQDRGFSHLVSSEAATWFGSWFAGLHLVGWIEKCDAGLPWCWTLAGLVAHADPAIAFSVDGPWDATVTITLGGGMSAPLSRPRRVSGMFGRIGTVGSTQPIALVLIETDAGSSGIGVTEDSPGEYVGELNLSGGAGDFVASAFMASFSDGDLDVDGDGRFSQSDVEALSDVVGTQDATNPEYTDWWDFDRDGEITSNDVEIMQSFIDSGCGSGILGDFNLDNIADCDDLAAILDAIDNEEDPFDDYIIGDAEYRVELDADLDGDNDADDWYIIYGLLQPADINRDGEVNSVDFVQYLNLYNAQDPAADMNGDGQVNSVDFVIYLNYYNNPC